MTAIIIIGTVLVVLAVLAFAVALGAAAAQADRELVEQHMKAARARLEQFQAARAGRPDAYDLSGSWSREPAAVERFPAPRSSRAASCDVVSLAFERERRRGGHA